MANFTLVGCNIFSSSCATGRKLIVKRRKVYFAGERVFHECCIGSIFAQRLVEIACVRFLRSMT